MLEELEKSQELEEELGQGTSVELELGQEVELDDGQGAGWAPPWQTGK